MDERVIQFRVGVVVIVAAIIGGTLILLFREGDLLTNQYTIYMDFAEAPGVLVDTPIRKNGVTIGRISHVELRDDGVRLTATIDSKHRLRKRERPRIGTGSLLGDAVVDFVPGRDSDAAAMDFYESGDLIENGAVASDPLSVLVNLEPDLTSAVRSIDEAGQNMSTAAESFNTLLGNNRDRLNRISQKTEGALDEFRASMAGVNKIVGDEEINRNLKRSLETLPELLEEVDETFEMGRTAIATLQRVGNRAEKNLENLEGFTRPLGERGESLVDNIDRSVRNIDLLLAQLVEFSKALNNRDGTLGRLVYDPSLYDRLNRAVGNVEEVSRQFGPIMNDVRVFTDKIARDPRQLGLKGALDMRPSGMGLKISPGQIDALPSQPMEVLPPQNSQPLLPWRATRSR